MNIGTRITSYAILPLCILAFSLRPGATVAASVATPHKSALPYSASFAYAMQTAPDSGKKDTPKDTIPEGKGKDVTKRVCTGCHSSDLWTSQRHTREEWSNVIDAMTSKGLQASDDELETINTYLATYLGPEQKKDAPPPDAGK